MEFLQECLGFLGEAFGQDSVVLEGQVRHPYGVSLQTQTTTELYQLYFLGEPVTLVLVAGAPKTQQLLTLQKELQGIHSPLVLAFRKCNCEETVGLLVAHDIPHLLPNQRLFAPSLGLLYRQHPPRRERQRTQAAAQLSSTGRHIVSCALLSSSLPWQQPWKPKELGKVLRMLLPRTTLSPASFVRALAELEELGFGASHGKRPHKTFEFFERDEIWTRLFRVESETIVRKAYLSEVPQHAVFAGTEALVQLGKLQRQEGAPREIAMSVREFSNLPDQRERKGMGNVVVQLWRQPPALTLSTPMAQCLNIVDLALTQRATVDPREREVLTELLEEKGLSPAAIWEVA